MTASLSARRTDLVGLALHSQGYLMIPQVFAPDLVDRVRAEFDAARSVEEQRFGVDALREIGQDGYLCDVPGMGPATRDLLDHDVIYDVLRVALDGQARLSIAQGIALDPGKGRGQWPRRWHADLFQFREAMPDPSFCFGVNCLVALDEMTVANGATCIVPASHALVTPLVSDGEELEQLAVSAVAPAGSLLVLDGGLWHAAGHNTTGTPRRILKLLFVRDWIRPQVDYPRVVPPSVAADLTPRVAALLGLGQAGDRTART